MSNDTESEAVDELPEITKIETAATVSPERNRAVIIWFANQSALRYVWDREREEIREQTYLDGSVHEDLGVGGGRDELAEFALESVGEYVRSYRDDPASCKRDWPHVYEMLVAEPSQR